MQPGWPQRQTVSSRGGPLVAVCRQYSLQYAWLSGGSHVQGSFAHFFSSTMVGSLRKNDVLHDPCHGRPPPRAHDSAMASGKSPFCNLPVR